VTADAVAAQDRTMTKLTDYQLIVLSSAATREDGLAVVPAKMPSPAAKKVCASLVTRKLMRELRAKPGMPVWRQDEDDRSFSLMITKAGRTAINADDAPMPMAVPKVAKGASNGPSTATWRALKGVDEAPVKASKAPRAVSKQAIIIEMLGRVEGATLDAMIEATGWLPHSIRAMLTGLRKKGFELDRVREDGVTRYRILKHPVAKAA
jgi:Protein of unknown function (DUF3489)